MIESVRCRIVVDIRVEDYRMYWTVICGFFRDAVTVNSVEAALLADVDALDRERLGAC